MSDVKSPQRFHEGNSPAAEDLRLLLEKAHLDTPSKREIDLLWKQVGEAVSGAAPLVSPNAMSSEKRGGHWNEKKLWIAGVASALVVSGVAWLQLSLQIKEGDKDTQSQSEELNDSPHDESIRIGLPSHESGDETPELEKRNPPASRNTPATDIQEASQTTISKHPSQAKSKKRIAISEASYEADDYARLDEAAILLRARKELNQNPLVALGFVEEHERKYPKGDLSQERELIAIDALSRLGRNAEVKERGTLFMDSFPTSPHLQKIKNLVEGQ